MSRTTILKDGANNKLKAIGVLDQFVVEVQGVG
jgi:hypothetical protein